jgi:hypothetical protein
MSSILSFNQYLLLNPLNEATSNEATTVINSFYSAVKSTQVEESPRGSNKGPKVEPLQKGVRANPGDPWCAAFVYGVLSKTGFSPDIKNQIPKDAAVRYHWANSKGKKIVGYPKTIDINSILPGMVFCYLSMDKKTKEYPGHGHTGIVLSVDKANKTWTGVEGNTNPLDGGREGYGTFIVSRNLSNPSIAKDRESYPARMLGFIDYFAPYRKIPGFTEALTLKLKSLTNELLPKTNNEIAYLKANPKVLSDYENNYNNRNKS